MGTAEALLLPVEKPVMDPQIGQQGYAQSVHVVAGRYCLVGGLYTSGVCVDWFREILGGDAGYATLIAAAEAIPPASLGTLFLPHLRLSNPPNDDPRGRSAFVGLSTDVKREALFRAVLEGLAYEFRHSLEPLLGYADLSELRRVACIGGGTRNNLLLQIKASVLNHPLSVVDVTEATTLGAAILGGLGAGVYGDVPAALSQLDYSQIPIEPDEADAALYDSYFRRVYQNLYPTLRALHHTIYDLQNPPDDTTAAEP
jgi:xylulokinase